MSTDAAPRTMRAVAYHRYGPPEVLQLETRARPRCGEDELLIRVRAAEATKADCEMRSFRYSVKWFWLPLRLALGVRRPRRQILGSYFSGEVAECGTNTRGFAVGDAIYGSANLKLGAYGEYVALPARFTLARKPDNLTYAEAAAVPLGGLNGLHFMRLAKIEAGNEVLINGAGGAIGLHAVQIAKAFGARVTAVDSARKAAMVERYRVDHFIDYQQEDFRERDQRYDVIFDMVPSSPAGKTMRCLRPGGRYLSGNPRLKTMVRCLWANRFSDKRAIFAFARENREELGTLTRMIETGEIQSIVDRVYPMAEAAAAHRAVEAEDRLGAIVIDLQA